MSRPGVSHYNMLDTGPRAPVEPGDTAAIKAEFARRLQTAMVAKGWNQSELARRATEHLPKPAAGQKRGHAIGRDLISHYVRAAMLPGPTNLEAMAKALGVKSADLLPAGVPSASGEAAPFEVRGMADGRLYLRIARTVSAETGMKILALLAEEDRQS
jgi:transcriptional regulator with XRE-family HTH domain